MIIWTKNDDASYRLETKGCQFSLINKAVFGVAFITCSVLAFLTPPPPSTVDKPPLAIPWPAPASERDTMPPSESFGDSKYSEDELFDSDGKSSLPPPPHSLSTNSDDSLGLSLGERAIIRVMGYPGLAGSDELDERKEESLEELEDDEDDEEEGDGKDDRSGKGGISGISSSSEGSNSGGDGGNKGSISDGNDKSSNGGRSTSGKAPPA